MVRRNKVAGAPAAVEGTAPHAEAGAVNLIVRVSKPRGRSLGLPLCDTTVVLSREKHDQLRQDLTGLVGARREAEVEAASVRL